MTTIIISGDEVTIVSKSEEKSSKQDFHPGYTWRTNDSFAMAGFYAKAGQECGVDVILDNRTFGQDDRKVGGVAVYTKGATYQGTMYLTLSGLPKTPKPMFSSRPKVLMMKASMNQVP
jgi:hypothetical protein